MPTRLSALSHQLLSEIQVASRKFDDASFAIPPNAQAFPACNRMVDAWSPMDDVWGASHTGIGETYVYAIVEADGRAHDLTVYGGSKGLQRKVTKAARRWNFYPAHCGATTVASEFVFPLVRVVRGFDSSGTSSDSYQSNTSSYDIFRPYNYPPDAADINTYRVP